MATTLRPRRAYLRAAKGVLWSALIGMVVYWTLAWSWAQPFMAVPRTTWEVSRLPPPTALPVPVQGVRAARIADTFGAPRGADRTHAGVAIFASRGTPVLSTTRGIVVSLRDGGLGGRQVWVLGPARERHYYAHLHDWQRAAEGDVVERARHWAWSAPRQRTRHSAAPALRNLRCCRRLRPLPCCGHTPARRHARPVEPVHRGPSPRCAFLRTYLVAYPQTESVPCRTMPTATASPSRPWRMTACNAWTLPHRVRTQLPRRLDAHSGSHATAARLTGDERAALSRRHQAAEWTDARSPQGRRRPVRTATPAYGRVHQRPQAAQHCGGALIKGCESAAPQTRRELTLRNKGQGLHPLGRRT